MIIGNVNKAASLKILKRTKRIPKYQNQEWATVSLDSSSKTVLPESETASTSYAAAAEMESTKSRKMINTLDLTRVAMECDRFGVSDRCAATNTTAF